MSRELLSDLLPPAWINRFNLNSKQQNEFGHILQELAKAANEAIPHGRFAVSAFCGPPSLLISVEFDDSTSWAFYLRIYEDLSWAYSTPQTWTATGPIPRTLEDHTPLGRTCLKIAAVFEHLHGFLRLKEASAA